MRFSLSVASVLLAVGIPALASAQSSKLLLGIPFGGKLQLSQCPVNTDKATRPCWIDRPFFYKPTGSSSGHVFLPDSDGRPKWAAHAMFKLTLDRAGLVQEIRVNTLDAQMRHQSSESISSRFGPPMESNLLREDASWASWRTAEGSVALRCQRECLVEFRTPLAQSALDAELAARAKRDAARPTAP